MGSNLYLKACETPWRGRARARAGNIINIRDCGARGHREGIREAADLSDETSKTDLVERQLRASVYQGSGSRPIKTTQRRRGRLAHAYTHTHSACSLVTLNHIAACPLFTPPGFFFFLPKIEGRSLSPERRRRGTKHNSWLHPGRRLSLASRPHHTSSIVSKMMRLSRQLNVARTSARLVSTHVQPSLTQFETSLTANARQLLGNDSPTTVLPLVREARCHALDPRRPPAVTPYLIRATHSTS